MQEEERTLDAIQSSLKATRTRVDEDLGELARRIQALSDSIPTWLKVAGITAGVIAVRRPLFRLVRSLTVLSSPVVIPILVGKLIQRQRSTGEPEPTGPSTFEKKDTTRAPSHIVPHAAGP